MRVTLWIKNAKDGQKEDGVALVAWLSLAGALACDVGLVGEASPSL